MTELPAIEDLARFTGLTPAEIAAAKTDLHMSTCPRQVWDCLDCAHKLKEYRAVIEAVTPLIERHKQAELVDRIAAAVESYEPEAHPVVCPPAITYAAAKEKAVEIVRGFAPVEPEGQQ